MGGKRELKRECSCVKFGNMQKSDTHEFCEWFALENMLSQEEVLSVSCVGYQHWKLRVSFDFHAYKIPRKYRTAQQAREIIKQKIENWICSIQGGRNSVESLRRIIIIGDVTRIQDILFHYDFPLSTRQSMI